MLHDLALAPEQHRCTRMTEVSRSIPSSGHVRRPPGGGGAGSARRSRCAEVNAPGTASEWSGPCCPAHRRRGRIPAPRFAWPLPGAIGAGFPENYGRTTPPSENLARGL